MATSMNPRAFAYQWQPPPQPWHPMALERVHHIRVSSEYANIYIYACIYIYTIIVNQPHVRHVLALLRQPSMQQCAEPRINRCGRHPVQARVGGRDHSIAIDPK